MSRLSSSWLHRGERDPLGDLGPAFDLVEGIVMAEMRRHETCEEVLVMPRYRQYVLL